MLRRLALACALSLSACSPTHGVPIFLWHSVGEGNPGDPYDLPATELSHQFDLLEEWGAHPVTLDALFQAIDGNGTLPKRPVVLSFDDGRLCQLTQVLPLLQKHHFVAETFVVVSYLRDDAAHRFILKDANGSHPMLTWPELEQMVKSGAFVPESHGLTHQSFHTLSKLEQRRDLAQSRAKLAARLHEPIDFFSYPYGAFDWTSRNLAEQAGYLAAFSVSKNPSTRFAIHRVSIRKGQTDRFLSALREAYGSPPSKSTKW